MFEIKTQPKIAEKVSKEKDDDGYALALVPIKDEKKEVSCTDLVPVTDSQ